MNKSLLTIIYEDFKAIEDHIVCFQDQASILWFILFLGSRLSSKIIF